MSDTITKAVELLLQNSLVDLEKKVQESVENAKTAYEAQLEGLKVVLTGKMDELQSMASDRPLSINFGTIEKPVKELVHSKFFDCLNILKSQKRIQKNMMFVGEAGSGKTHLACSLAKAMNLKFYPMSVGLQTTKSDLLGFINAHGQYVTSPVREAFEKGGILLLDEFDSAHAGVVTIINSLLANGHCSFPDKIVDKHKDFICIVACNTYGHGANIDYVGRNRLDGATLDRFIVVDVGYDEGLEKSLTSNDKWLETIEKIRENAKTNGIKIIISPRASMNGADLLEVGFDMEDVLDMCVFKGIDEDTRYKLMRGVTVTRKIIPEEQKLTGSIQQYTIRTQNANFDNCLSYNPENNVIDRRFGDDETPDIHGFRVRFGAGWSPQFDGKETLFFAHKPNHKFTSNESSWVKNFFECLDAHQGDNKIKGDVNIRFDFIKYGCRKPWKTLILEAKHETV